MELIKWDKIAYQIDNAKDINELKKLSDKLEAIRVLAKQSKQSLETQNKIAKYRLKVERKKGEWLDKNPLNKGGNPNLSSDTTGWKLSDIGITRDESSQAQQIAKIPEKKFNEIIRETENNNQEITKNMMVNEFKKIRRQDNINKQEEDIKKGIAQPTGTYDLIVIDPPWNYNTQDVYDPINNRGFTSYPEMKHEELMNLKIPSNDNCIMFLWTTHRFIWDAKELLDKWGFEYKNILTWDKEKMGIGKWLRLQCEFCLIGIKGRPLWTARDIRDIIREPRREHSRKPEAFYELIDCKFIGTKLDYFSREKRKGWASFGNDIDKFKGK